MEDLSLHILDIVENSIEAGATSIRIKIIEDLKRDSLKIDIMDNGRGMDDEVAQKALDPFFTTKSVRRVGLGLSLFREAARVAGGDLVIQSRAGKGTTVRAHFQRSHIDRKPLGDMTRTMIDLIVGHPQIRFKYTRQKNGQKGELDTQKLRKPDGQSSLSVVGLAALIKKNFPEIT